MIANKLLIGAAVILSAGALTAGIVSAGTSGQTQGEPTPSPDESPTATPAPTDAPDEGSETPQATDPELEDADSGDESVSDESADATGAQKVAGVIAEEFETTPEEVLAFHDDGIGFGALFKLYSIARAKGITVDELLAEIESAGGGFAFGKLIKSLTEDEMAIFESGPKNLGELVSAASKNDGAEAASAEIEPEAPANQSQGRSADAGGPPPHAKAKGHGKKN